METHTATERETDLPQGRVSATAQVARGAVMQVDPAVARATAMAVETVTAMVAETAVAMAVAMAAINELSSFQVITTKHKAGFMDPAFSFGR